jgi:hypothetical protein
MTTVMFSMVASTWGPCHAPIQKGLDVSAIITWKQIYVKDITKDIKYTCYLANACDIFNFLIFCLLGNGGAIPFIKQIAWVILISE